MFDMLKKIISNIFYDKYMKSLDKSTKMETHFWDNNFLSIIIPPNIFSKTDLFSKSVSTLAVAHVRSNNIICSWLMEVDLSDLKFVDEDKFYKNVIHNFYRILKTNKNIKIKKIIHKKFMPNHIYFFITIHNIPCVIHVESLLYRSDSQLLILMWYNNQYKNNKYITNTVKKLREMCNDIYIKQLFLNDKVLNLYNKLDTFAKKYMRLGIGRYIILLYGPPGTGKTYLATLLHNLLSSRYKICRTSDIKTKLKSVIIHEDKTGHAMVEEVNDNLDYDDVINFEIIDEFDSYISVMEGDSIRARYNTGVMKKALDTAHDIVILISNNVDKIDPAILRHDRINLKINVDENFYSIEDKKRLVKQIFANRNIDISEIQSKIKNIDYTKTIASVISEVKEILLEM